MDLAVDWVLDERGFEDLASEWSDLAPDDERPFDLHCWYRAWWHAFGRDRDLAVCVARRDGLLSAVLPLVREGGGAAALANAHTPVFRPLAKDPEALNVVLGEALRADSSVELPHLPAADPSVAALRRQAPEARMRLYAEAGPVSPIVDTSGDFQAWRTESKRRWGAPLERFRRKMARDHDAVLSIIEPASELEAELSDGFNVEASGWKGTEGTAILSAPETEAFYREIARSFADRDELRLSRVVLDGETAAFDLCILHRGRLYLLKTGFDERFRRLAPGLVMRLSIIERCFELGLDAHELLGDDSAWKRKFATGERVHLNARTYSRGPLGSARYAYRARVRPTLRMAYRRVRPRTR